MLHPPLSINIAVIDKVCYIKFMIVLYIMYRLCLWQWLAKNSIHGFKTECLQTKSLQTKCLQANVYRQIIDRQNVFRQDIHKQTRLRYDGPRTNCLNYSLQQNFRSPTASMHYSPSTFHLKEIINAKRCSGKICIKFYPSLPSFTSIKIMIQICSKSWSDRS